MSFYKVDYVRDSFDREPKLVTNPKFIIDLMRLPTTELDIRTARTANDPKVKENAKKRLPAIVWGGHFRGGVRRDSEVESSGLFCQDIDHIAKDTDGVRQYYARHFRGREDELGIVFAHVSPGGDGLHVVTLCQTDCETIAENQAWLAEATQSEYDKVCHNIGRIYYLAAYGDILYNDLF